MGSNSSKKRENPFPTTVLPIPTDGPRAVPGSAEKRFANKIQRLERCEQPCSEIFEHVYVSGYDVACNREELDKCHIRYIVNCASSACANVFESDPQFTYLTLNMMDGGSEDLGWFFPQLLAFIDEALNAQQSVLIHCQKGISRSCAVACLYGMHSKHMTFHVAANVVKARRSIASPNSIFLCNLIEMECLFRGQATSDQKFPVLFRVAHHAVWDASTVVLKMCRDPVTRIPIQAYPGLLRRDSCAVVLAFGTSEQCAFAWRGTDVSDELWAMAFRLISTLGKVLHLSVRCETQGKESTAFTELLANAPTPPELPAYDDVVRDCTLKSGEHRSQEGCGSNDGDHRVSDNGTAASAASAQDELSDKSVLLYHLNVCESGAATWQPLGVYDRDDLESHGMYFLQCKSRICAAEGHIWVGQAFLESMSVDFHHLDASQLADALRNRGLDIPTPTTFSGPGPQMHVEHYEDDRFWEVFESGY